MLLLRTVTATCYVTPLREGGSLPAIVEADDDGLYVVKFRGAAQGAKSLIAELIAGEIGRLLGLSIPEIVYANVDPALGRNEPNAEIQDLLKASAGLNLALDYLPGALSYDPLVGPPVDAALASAVVWFDAYTMNVDRTARNPNLLLWHQRLWLIDHGAALYVHHGMTDLLPAAARPFAPIREHVLLPRASALDVVDAEFRPRLTRAALAEIVAAVPDAWLVAEMPDASPVERRAAYLALLEARRDASALFVEEANRARALLV